MANEQICFAIVDKKKDGKVIASAILLNHVKGNTTPLGIESI